MSDVLENKEFTLLPLRELLVFPDIVASFFISRTKSINAAEYATKFENNKIILASQKEPSKDYPSEADFYKTGVLGEIVQFLKMPDGTLKVLVKGIKVVKINSITDEEEIFKCNVTEIERDDNYSESSMKIIREDILSTFKDYAQKLSSIKPLVVNSVSAIENYGQFLYSIVSHLNIQNSEKQKILEEKELYKKFIMLLAILEVEIELIKVEKRLKDRVKKQMEKNQKEYFLNEQLKAIKKELNAIDSSKDELKLFEKKIKKLDANKDVKEKLSSELNKLSSMNPMSAEASVVRNYIEWVLSLPWGVKSKVNINLDKAQKELDTNHYGLSKVKEQVLEYLAVQKRVDKVKGPIMCLVGPPGVGKTSLAQSIAKASGREFVRISLGGVRDEAEIRGHRRTYIGAMPGKVIQVLKKAKVNNALVLLDEIDKMGYDFRGDPSSALLEVLDPEQNDKFVDHYIEVEYDLSNVMFLTTANSYNIPEPLLDRMEIIGLSGYTEKEKLNIAQNYFVPNYKKEFNIKKQELEISEDAIIAIIRNYTREAGVRSLSRALTKVMRKAIKEIDTNKDIKSIKVDENNLFNYLGAAKYQQGLLDNNLRKGISTGLAWTKVGGEILHIEATKVPGKGNIQMTGKLGDVMKESVQAAFSLVKSMHNELGIDKEKFEKFDLHLHVPEGATPKDGPSAGIAIVTALVSCLKDVNATKSVAMTGEITLRGRVLPIGGLREKLLAALRYGIKTVIIPKENKKDLDEINQDDIKGLDVILAHDINDVLKVSISK